MPKAVLMHIHWLYHAFVGGYKIGQDPINYRDLLTKNFPDHITSLHINLEGLSCGTMVRFIEGERITML
jgi:hypothetical protein